MTQTDLEKNFEELYRYIEYGLRGNWKNAFNDSSKYIRELAEEKLK